MRNVKRIIVVGMGERAMIYAKESLAHPELFQIAGVGILVFAVNQVLQRAGREDIAVLSSVAGLVVVLFLVVDLVAQLLNNVKSIFGLY